MKYEDVKYEDVLKASDPNWKNEARQLIAQKKQFVVIELSPSDYDHCNSFAQEFDYECIVEHNGEELRFIVNEYKRGERPTKLGFIPEGYLKSKKTN